MRVLVVVILLSLIQGCAPVAEDKPKSNKTIEQVQEAYTNEWMAIPGVEGTGIGLSEGEPCIKVFSSVKPEVLHRRIPSTVEGFPVIIEETGGFGAL